MNTVPSSSMSMRRAARVPHGAPRFTQAVKAGRLRVLDATCPVVYAALKAGAKAQPSRRCAG
jgi:glutaconate CoA-transferase subunit A